MSTEQQSAENDPAYCDDHTHAHVWHPTGWVCVKTYPCCPHCRPEESTGKCWAHKVGHGCSCLDCETTPAAPSRRAEVNGEGDE